MADLVYGKECFTLLADCYITLILLEIGAEIGIGEKHNFFFRFYEGAREYPVTTTPVL